MRVLILFLALSSGAMAAAQPYEPTWESIDRRPTPAWFTEAKFGIFIHWGAYSVPAFDNEWYPRNMYVSNSTAFKHHVAAYGPQSQFGRLFDRYLDPAAPRTPHDQRRDH